MFVTEGATDGKGKMLECYFLKDRIIKYRNIRKYEEA